MGKDCRQQWSIDSLKSRLIKADLLLCFKTMRGFIDIDTNNLFTVDSVMLQEDMTSVSKTTGNNQLRSSFSF